LMVARRVLATAVFAAFTWTGASHVARAADTKAEKRVCRIEDDLLPADSVIGESRRKIKLIDRMAVLKVPGLSVAVIHEGRIDWARGYGVSKEGGPTVTSQTLFQAASISKAISALAALHAVDVGRLSLDGDVNQYLKHWKVPFNSFTNQTKVTLRELLTHTAGMTVHGFHGYSPGASLPTLGQVLEGTPPANTPPIRVDILPGTQWRYSGGGYVVVQQLLEDVTGEPFARFVKENVFTPVGMDHSTFEQPLPEQLIGDVAMPHDAEGGPLEGGVRVYPEEAPAGLWTTPSDLARYAIEVQRSLEGKSKRVLSQAMTRQMLTPGMNYWGLGLRIGGSTAEPYFEHAGSNVGYKCDLVAYQNGEGAVVMTNSDNGDVLISEVLGTIAHEYGWADYQPTTHRIAKIDPRRFDLLAGSYQLEGAPTFIVTFTREGDHFLSQATRQGQDEVFPENEHEYFSKAVGAQFAFETDGKGRARRLVMRQGGREATAERLDDAAAKRIADALTRTNSRVREQKALPGSEPAVRRLMIELASGTPDYERMSPSFADQTRRQLEQLQKLVLQLGAVESVTFLRVRPEGADVYRVACEHGAAEWRILLSADAKIDDASFQLRK
jgi:CubicO group peptidase (beta-lactamase class C family)